MPTSSRKPEPPELLGRQEPRLYTLPPRAGTLAEDALDLWTVAGRELDPWQELSIDGIFSVDAFGLWTCTEWGELVARQNGKGDIITAYCLAKLFLWPKRDGTPRTIVYTAHQFKTAREMFRRMRFIIESSPLLMAELKGGPTRGIATAHGEEGFELANGNRLLYLARSRNSGVGFTVDDLVVDEAQEASIAAMDALLPTMSSVENTQVLFFGTVPDELNDAEYWEGVRDRGRAGIGARTGWMEFNPDGSDDPDVAAKIDIYSDEAAAQGNPGLGYRPGLTLEQITDERGEPGIEGRMSKDSYRRQRLSIWPNRRPEVKSKLSELDLTMWDRHVSEDHAVAAEGMVLSLALGRGGGYGTIGKGIRVDESIVVEHHMTDRGTRWIADELKKLKKDYGNPLLVLDSKNAAAVISSLDRAGVKYLAMNLDEIAAAHALFIEHVNAGLVPHRPQGEVRKSLEFATTRNIGRAGVTWEQSDPTKPVTMAQAVTWALWGVLKSEASPKKPPPPPPPQAEAVTREASGLADANLASARF